MGYTKKMYDAIIIGAGAAGMMAAISASRLGKSVLVLEKNSRVGRKILITGKGRCNVTNNCDNDEFLRNIPKNPRFLFSAISAFSCADTMDFFETARVPLVTERGKRVFPQSEKAADIAHALEREAKALCDIKTADVLEITAENGLVSGVRTSIGDFAAKSVILATGGLSYPKTGSDGAGFRMAKALGHKITLLSPSLIPIVTEESFAAELMGLSLKNVRLDVFAEGTKKPVFSEQGELLFTHFGLSGPLVLSASAHMREMGKKSYEMFIDLKPALSEKQLDSRILRDWAELSNKDFANSLGGLLPSKLIPVVVRLSQIPPQKKVNEITRAERLALISVLKGLKLTAKAFRPIDEAIITSGGVDVREINPKTMESKLVGGLFFAGEIIDCDGYTGGFNLQIAFSTGWLAGLSC